MKESVIKQTSIIKFKSKRSHSESKISENHVIPRFPGHVCKKRLFLKAQLLFFTIVHRNHNVCFRTFCVFLHFRTRILNKDATVLIDFSEQRNGFFNTLVFCIFAQGFSLKMQLSYWFYHVDEKGIVFFIVLALFCNFAQGSSYVTSATL